MKSNYFYLKALFILALTITSCKQKLLYYKVDSIDFYLVKTDSLIMEKFLFLKESNENETISGVLLRFNVSYVAGDTDKGKYFTASYSGMYGCIDSLEDILVEMNNDTNISELKWSSFENIEGVNKEGDQLIKDCRLVPNPEEYYDEKKPVGIVFQAENKQEFINHFNAASTDNPKRNGEFGNPDSFHNYYLLKLDDDKIFFNEKNKISVKFIFSNNYIVKGKNRTKK